MWLKSCQVKVDIGQDIAKYDLTNQICSWFESDQLTIFLLCCVCCGQYHPNQTPEFHWLTAWVTFRVIGLSLVC